MISTGYYAYIYPINSFFEYFCNLRLLEALLLREPVTLITVIAMCIILAGVALMVTTTGKGKREGEGKGKDKEKKKMDNHK
ncbi:MAG: hypothetical protein M3297_06760 [Thermoproteota archaeon]|nr:hypothetical protein [Thermoproteota archaeon]